MSEKETPSLGLDKYAGHTPLMRQYLTMREKVNAGILLFRLGDFYETFFEDAVKVSSLLDLTLTGKDCGLEKRAPMCGIPFHASKIYIARLLRLGKKIAICEQITLPNSKGLVERKVTEIITPGTTFEEDYLDRGANNFLAALVPVKHGKESVFSFAWLDVSTAVFQVCSWSKEKHGEETPKNLCRVSPCELLLPKSLEDDPVLSRVLSAAPGTIVSYYPDWQFSSEISYKKLISQFRTVNLRSFSLDENSFVLLLRLKFSLYIPSQPYDLTNDFILVDTIISEPTDQRVIFEFSDSESFITHPPYNAILSKVPSSLNPSLS